MDNNELIAEFMGYRNSAEVPEVYLRDTEPYGGHISNFDYDKSWDWLMPVVEKIESIPYEAKDPADDYNWNIPYIRTLGNKMCRINRMPLTHGETLIEAVYKSVIEYINWYNFQRDGVVLNTNTLTDLDPESKPSSRENDF